MTEQEIQKLIKMQRTFYKTGKTLDVDFRLRQLKRLRAGMSKYQTKILDALYTDLGKSSYEGFMCEFGLTLTELSYMEKHVRRLAANKLVKSPLTNFPAVSYMAPQPYGTVLIMSPWNYPILLTIEPLIDAIAAGNTVLLKPSAYSPATTAVMQDMIEDCFPPEYVAVVSGGRYENQALLDQHFDKIFFTGGTTVGKEVMRKAAEHLTPVTLELGGKSPVIVDHTAKISMAAKRIVFGKFLNVGQTCVAPDYVLCEKKVYTQLLTAIVREMKKQYGSDPLHLQSYGKMINQKHFDRVTGLIDPEKVVLGGESDPATLKIAPTLMRDVTWDDKVMGEEIFGPVLPVIAVENVDEAIEMVDQHPHPLALYVFSEDKQIQKKVLAGCRYGGGCINDTIIHLATTDQPFGGVGESGMGCYHGKEGFKCFTHERSIVDRKTFMELPIRYQPYQKIWGEVLKVLLR